MKFYMYERTLSTVLSRLPATLGLAKILAVRGVMGEQDSIGPRQNAACVMRNTFQTAWGRPWTSTLPTFTTEKWGWT